MLAENGPLGTNRSYPLNIIVGPSDDVDESAAHDALALHASGAAHWPASAVKQMSESDDAVELDEPVGWCERVRVCSV